MERPPFLAMPYPLDEYLDGLAGDYGKIARRLLRAASWDRQTTRNGVELDAGEALIDERSDDLWGGLALDRDVSAAGRRALVRRALERLERDGIVSRRSAHARGPKNGPANGPRNGPSPTVVRFLKFRAILWPASVETAQETAQGPAQETAQQNGPILPVTPPDPPEAGRAPAAASPRPASPRRARRSDDEETAAARDLRATAERLFLQLRGAPYTLATKQAVIADRVAARGLLAAAGGDLEAIAGRWREALAHEGFPRVDTLADLAKHWARFSPSPAVARRRLAPESRRGDLGVVYGGEWWLRLTAAEQDQFRAERQAIDPGLDADAPFPVTGVANPCQVEALIAQWRARANGAAQPRAAAGGAA